MIPSDPKPIRSNRLLLVEGWDEYQSLRVFLEGIGSDIEIRCIDGTGNWGQFLRSLPKFSGFSLVDSIGIITDADNDPHAAFSGIITQLGTAGLPAPSAPQMRSHGDPTVSIFISPGDDRIGEFEDLFLGAAAGDPNLECVSAFADCLNARSALPRKASKMRMQAFLAAHPEVYRRVGDACRDHVFDWAHAAFLPIREFLQNI